MWRGELNKIKDSTTRYMYLPSYLELRTKILIEPALMLHPKASVVLIIRCTPGKAIQRFVSVRKTGVVFGIF